MAKQNNNPKVEYYPVLFGKTRDKDDKRKELVAKCLELIEKYKITFIDELVAYLPISRATFYNYSLDKIDTIKEALDKNKVLIKKILRTHWMKAGASATAQIALYKLLATPDERRILNNSLSEHENGNEETEVSNNFFEALNASTNEIWKDEKA